MRFLKTIRNLILALFSLPFVLLMRILSPFVIVRIFVLDFGRIGAVLPHLDMYISRRDAGLEGSRNFDIYCFTRGKVANYQIKKMVERIVPIHPFAFWVDKVNKRMPGWEKYAVPCRSRLNCNSALKASPNLSFTEKELQYGQEELKKLGVPQNNPFICFHARDAAYLNTYQPQANWDYHSYRNADISNYVPAVEKLVGKGYCAIRMGRFVGEELQTDNPRIIDYAAKGGTDFLDMYLGAHCRFFIAGSDGLAEIPTIFRRPVVWIDFVPFSAVHLVAKGQLFIPKKLWSLKENRMLTFDEMINKKVAQYSRTEDYEKAGIKIVNNSPEEIIDVAMEMEDRLSGTWNETQEDQELQQQFNSIVSRNGRKFFGRIGAKFLRQHREFLNYAGLRQENFKSNEKTAQIIF